MMLKWMGVCGAVLLLTVATGTCNALTVSQSIVVQFKHISKANSKLLSDQTGTQSTDQDDSTHTKAFLASSVEWFLTGMLNKVAKVVAEDHVDVDHDDNDEQSESSKFSRLQIYRVAITSHMIGTPMSGSGGSNSNSNNSNNNNYVQAQSRMGNGGGRRQLESYPSTTTYSNNDNTNNNPNLVLVPLYVNMTITGDFAPTDVHSNLEAHEYEELLLHLFNNQGDDLVEKLQDLSAVDVSLFEHVTQIRAVSGSSLGAGSGSMPGSTTTTQQQSHSSLNVKKVALIAAISVGAVGILLLVAVFVKVYTSR
jgi:hypothetical protein